MTRLDLPKLIDASLWARAGWNGVAWAVPGAVPVMALLFADADLARTIFSGWQRALGEVDRRELLRVAIIEGDIPSLPPGYFAHLGLDLAAVAPLLGDATALAYDVTDGDVWHRLPNPDSPHLRAFKQAYAQARRYFLMPAVVSGSGADYITDLAIGKTRLTFRHVADVPRTGDPDSALWSQKVAIHR